MSDWDGLDDWEVLEEVDDNGEGLTSWEIEFVEKCWKRLERGVLTRPQREKLEQLAEQRIP